MAERQACDAAADAAACLQKKGKRPTLLSNGGVLEECPKTGTLMVKGVNTYGCPDCGRVVYQHRTGRDRVYRRLFV